MWRKYCPKEIIKDIFKGEYRIREDQTQCKRGEWIFCEKNKTRSRYK